MKFLQETTNWPNGTSNHLYVLNDSKDKMVAYRPVGKIEFTIFKKPIKIETRGRKFVEVENVFGFNMKEPLLDGKVHSVVGSKGETYMVTELRGEFTCSCSGFKFRSKCKHADTLKNKLIA